jgi:hypothetical protein
MWRIVFYPFNGPILCHMIESKQPAKTRHYMPASRPRSYALKIPGDWAKNWDAKN